MSNEKFEGSEALAELTGRDRMNTLLLVAAGGCAGAVARYGSDAFITKRLGSDFPWSTIIVNILAAFLLGVLTALVVERDILPALMRPALGIGFLASFSTFSTMTLDAVVLGEDGQMGRAALYLVISNVVGVGATLAGLTVARA